MASFLIIADEAKFNTKLFINKLHLCAKSQIVRWQKHKDVPIRRRP